MTVIDFRDDGWDGGQARVADPSDAQAVVRILEKNGYAVNLRNETTKESN